ncbi:MAG: CDP-alcohol phosphatidyltransferase family protein [candidate division Zixibacteria bacterium]|nr:CDP-alcohol phosphatidyltransferase family protein [candidate division Zixibacteria bacterium]
MPATGETIGSPRTLATSGARVPFDYEAIYKLPKSARYFNVSVLWIAYYPHLVRLLYALRIRHEVVTLLSLAFGLTAAGILGSHPSAASLVLAAILVHLKDVFDASDGSLARLTNTGHRIGRFLDTIGDGIVFTALIAAIAWNTIETGASASTTLVWAGATWLSLFLQCSYFNFYHLHYTSVSGAVSASRLDERDASNGHSTLPARTLYGLLHAVYVLWFAWQDSLIRQLDRLSLDTVRKRDHHDESLADHWYKSRGFLIANSALCYGTHAFILILCLLAGHPNWFFPAVAVGMNLYFAAIIAARTVYFRGVA